MHVLKWIATVLLLSFSMPTGAVAAEQPTTRKAAIRIALAGDSTVTDDAGWGGDAFKQSFNDKVEVLNFSKGGRSSKSFRVEGRWDKLIESKPNYVLIQFGHNDGPGKGPDRETDPKTTYRENMAKYVDDAIAAGAKPVLVTSIARRRWTKDNLGIDSDLVEYVEAVKSVAEEKKVPIIDLHQRSIEVYLSLGREACEEFISPFKKDIGGIDGTHFNTLGSSVMGPLMADALMQVVPEIQKFRAGYKAPTTRATASTRPATIAPAAAAGELKPHGAKTLTVAADGSAEYRRVQDAIAAVPDNNSDVTIIKIKPGVYYGQIVIPRSKANVTLLGEGPDKTILTYALNVYDPIPANVVRLTNGNGVVATGPSFRAENLTMRNTSGDHGQAMALRLESDRAVLSNVHLLGWQDTLLTHSGRHYYKDCYIEGRVDFIYGGSTDYFENCEIRSKNGGYITAASTPEDRPFGYVFRNCKLTSIDNVPTYLGRPWRPFASVAFINCDMGAHIKPEGWHNWGKETNEKTSRYVESGNTGAGANIEKRISWSKKLSKEEAAKITVQSVLGGSDNWDPTK